jgi:hypothetical protein
MGAYLLYRQYVSTVENVDFEYVLSLMQVLADRLMLAENVWLKEGVEWVM